MFTANTPATPSAGKLVAVKRAELNYLIPQARISCRKTTTSMVLNKVALQSKVKRSDYKQIHRVFVIQEAPEQHLDNTGSDLTPGLEVTKTFRLPNSCRSTVDIVHGASLAAFSLQLQVDSTLQSTSIILWYMHAI